MSKAQIFLVKHGETVENQMGIHQGQTLGGTLSDRGATDVRYVGEALAKAGIVVDRLLVSPMPRCRQSARILAVTVTPQVVEFDDRLSAKNSGHLGGRPRDQAAREAARLGVPIHRLRSPGGESSEDVQARIVDLWESVTAAPEGTTVLVGHGGGIACLLLHLIGIGFEQYLDFVPGSAATTRIEISRQSLHWHFVNADPHSLSHKLRNGDQG
jgi:broad specificity phosphatase PhoE